MVSVKIMWMLHRLLVGLVALTRQWKRLVYMPILLQAHSNRLQKRVHPQFSTIEAMDSVDTDSPNDETPDSATESEEDNSSDLDNELEVIIDSPLKTMSYDYQSASTGVKFVEMSC